MGGLVENCRKDEAWACIQGTAKVPEPLEKFVSADVDLVCSEELTDNVILTHVNAALKDEKRRTTLLGRKCCQLRLTNIHEHFHGILSNSMACKVKCFASRSWEGS